MNLASMHRSNRLQGDSKTIAINRSMTSITPKKAQAGVRVFEYSFTSPVGWRVPRLIVMPVRPACIL